MVECSNAIPLRPHIRAQRIEFKDSIRFRIFFLRFFDPRQPFVIIHVFRHLIHREERTNVRSTTTTACIIRVINTLSLGEIILFLRRCRTRILLLTFDSPWNKRKLFVEVVALDRSIAIQGNADSDYA